MTAARDVQNALKQKKPVSTTTGCSILLQVLQLYMSLIALISVTCIKCLGFEHAIFFPCFLQILYFESINMGTLNRPGGISPRVKVYDAKSLSMMIATDKASSATGSANPTWGSSVVCYQFKKYPSCLAFLCVLILLPCHCSDVCQKYKMNHFTWHHAHVLMLLTRTVPEKIRLSITLERMSGTSLGRRYPISF